MSGSVLFLVLDILILFLLAAVIFFTARLSLNLRDFREGKRDMDNLVNDLARNVGMAEAAISGLRNAAREAGRDLQGMINEAKSLAEELEIMSESGNNIAGRLESAAQRRRKTVAEPPEKPSFAIRDPEFEQESGGSFEEEDFLNPEGLSGNDVRSRAERELYEALQSGGRVKGRKKTDAGGVA
ncbi:MAG: hypothetical protein HY370_07895 [Proteobacteria bacterium]|nr:hypothetical protein [Pseudomonadota bacterium]